MVAQHTSVKINTADPEHRFALQNKLSGECDESKY